MRAAVDSLELDPAHRDTLGSTSSGPPGNMVNTFDE
jgi:hypothetical protein